MPTTVQALLRCKTLLLFLLLPVCLMGCHSEKTVFHLPYSQGAVCNSDEHRFPVMLDDLHSSAAVSRPGGGAQKRSTINSSARHSRVSLTHAGSPLPHRQLARETQRALHTAKQQLDNISAQTASVNPLLGTSKKGDFLQIVGTVLAVAGIVLGFVVGGWAGFGLFLLLALAGLFVSFWGGFVIDGNLP